MALVDDAGPGAKAGPHAFVADIESPVLSDDDHRHLARSLRLRPGDDFTVSDGRGQWRACRFGDAITAAGDVKTVAVLAPAIVLGVALTKGSKPEVVTQKLTELGVDRVVLFASDHSVVAWDDATATRKLERLRRVAREAAMQSRRVRLPEVSFEASIDALPSTASRADFDGVAPTVDIPMLLIGPEGGWSERERAAVPASMCLGTQVLRAETAAIAAGSLLTALRLGLVGHSA